MVRLIALTVTRAWSDSLRWRSQEHQRQGSVGRPGHRLHKAGQAWLGRLRGMQYQKCRLCIEGGPGQTLGETFIRRSYFLPLLVILFSADKCLVCCLICSTVLLPRAIFQWERGRRSHTFSSQTLFISVFYMNFTWTCNKNVITCSWMSNTLLNLFS